MKRPRAVLIGDIHYSMSTLEMAEKSTNLAAAEAERLGVPLILNGDINDTKSIIRAECMNSLIATMQKIKQKVFVVIGNHDLIDINTNKHSLEFLSPYCVLIDRYLYDTSTDLHFIAYQHHPLEFKKIIDTIPKGATVVAHQGVVNASMGHYIKDSSAVPRGWFADVRTLLSHYHARQEIDYGPSQLSYIGNPYTLTFGEANDPPKGFRVLNHDGTLDFISTNLRKHVKVKRTAQTVLDPIPNLNPDDLLWLEVTDTYLELSKLDKVIIGNHHLGHQNFKLDKISDIADTKLVTEEKPLSGAEQMDALIDNLKDGPEQTLYLKSLWRTFL